MRMEPCLNLSFAFRALTSFSIFFPPTVPFAWRSSLRGTPCARCPASIASTGTVSIAG